MSINDVWVCPVCHYWPICGYFGLNDQQVETCVERHELSTHGIE